MKIIKKDFLENYDILRLNTNAKTINEIAVKDSDGYIFTPLPLSDNEPLINTILRKSKEVNHSLLNNWQDKPWSDDEIYNTANSYLTNQFESSKLNIKNEIPITGEENAKFRFSQLLKMYLPILVAHLTLHYKYAGGYNTFLKALSWDEDTIFLPLPVDENGLIIWDDIFDENEEDEEVEQDPITYDTSKIEEFLVHIYEKLCVKIDHKTDELKNFITTYISKNMSDNNDVKEENEFIEKEVIVEDEATNREDNSEEYKELLKENKELKEANENFKREMKKLEDKLSLIKHDNEDLMKRDSEHDDVVEELQEEIANLKQEIESLNLELENRTPSGNEETSAIIGVKDNEIAELKRELETRTENEQLLRDRNAELEEADNKLRKELNKVSEENTHLTKKLSDVQTEITEYIDINRKLERDNNKLMADNKHLEKSIGKLEKEIVSIKKENGLEEIEKLKEDNRILRQALEDLKRKSEKEKYMDKELPKEPDQLQVPEKDPEVLAREKANRDRIGRMIYGDAYDGTQTF